MVPEALNKVKVFWHVDSKASRKVPRVDSHMLNLFIDLTSKSEYLSKFLLSGRRSVLERSIYVSWVDLVLRHVH